MRTSNTSSTKKSNVPTCTDAFSPVNKQDVQLNGMELDKFIKNVNNKVVGSFLLLDQNLGFALHKELQLDFPAL